MFKKKQAPRRALLISSNKYMDRDNEIVSNKALEDYVKFCHDEKGNYIGKNTVLWWHDGESIGRVLECILIHGFLVEIVEELPNDTVNIGTSDEPYLASIKACWDMIEEKQDELGVSQGFLYDTTQADGNVFNRIIKYESSVLPLSHASNPFTFIRILTP